MSPSLDCKCTLKLNFSNPMSRLQPQWANHTSSLIACFAHCILSSAFYFFAFEGCRMLGLPGPASFVSRGRAGFSQFWWGRGCLCAYRATASAAAPCPAEPDACVSLSRRWDDPYREKKHHQKSTSARKKKGCEKVSHFCVRVCVCLNLLTAATKSAAAGV